MDIGRWEDAVTFETMRRGEYRVVASTAEAAHILVTQWPLRTGRAYHRAQKTFVDVLAGKQSAEAARNAFLKAAEEAGVVIRP
jgi:hypothetical protein